LKINEDERGKYEKWCLGQGGSRCLWCLEGQISQSATSCRCKCEWVREGARREEKKRLRFHSFEFESLDPNWCEIGWQWAVGCGSLDHSSQKKWFFTRDHAIYIGHGIGPCSGQWAPCSGGAQWPAHVHVQYICRPRITHYIYIHTRSRLLGYNWVFWNLIPDSDSGYLVINNRVTNRFPDYPEPVSRFSCYPKPISRLVITGLNLHLYQYVVKLLHYTVQNYYYHYLIIKFKYYFEQLFPFFFRIL
jgi:hypothetical protein